jgi:hypothetical protein
LELLTLYNKGFVNQYFLMYYVMSAFSVLFLLEHFFLGEMTLLTMKYIPQNYYPFIFLSTGISKLIKRDIDEGGTPLVYRKVMATDFREFKVRVCIHLRM